MVFGVSTGFGDLWGRITQIGGTDNNIDDVAIGCEVACAAGNVYDYCTVTRTLSFGKDISCVNDETGIEIQNCKDCKYIEDPDEDGDLVAGSSVPDCLLGTSRSKTCETAKDILGISCNICPAE